MWRAQQDWIAKNRSHLRSNPTLRPQLDALDIEDSDPTWLKGKGDDFFRARDYRAAVNVSPWSWVYGQTFLVRMMITCALV